MRFDSARPAAVVRTAVLIGILAGLATALFMTVTGEPWVDDAIRLEEASVFEDEAEAHTAHDHAHEPEIVSRADQRGVGLFSAYGLIGGAFGMLLALVFLAQGRGRSAFGRSLLAGAALGGAITVAPWLKYPPNPPAVGDPETLSQRQWQYMAVIVITGLLFVAGARLSRRLRDGGWPEHRRLTLVSAGIALAMSVTLALLPAPPDPVGAPANLVWHFRLASLGGNLLLWAVLSIGFGVLATERAKAGGDRPAVPVTA
jgi:predicted cobalt transporter CbtA